MNKEIVQISRYEHGYSFDDKKEKREATYVWYRIPVISDKEAVSRLEGHISDPDEMVKKIVEEFVKG